MTASSNKSSVTLITTDRHLSNHQPHLTLNNSPIPTNKSPKILGITFDTHLTFTKHIQNITASANKKLNILKIITSSNIDHNKQLSITTYKQFIRPVLNYASPVWYPSLSKKNINTLQTTQNKALRNITGCTSTTPQQHLHDETNILPINTHLEMI